MPVVRTSDSMIYDMKQLAGFMNEPDWGTCKSPESQATKT